MYLSNGNKSGLTNATADIAMATNKPNLESTEI